MSFVQVLPSDSRYQQFLDFPKALYPSGSPRFATPEVIPTEFHVASFMAVDKGKPLARASLYHNPALHFGEHTAFMIGNYECVDDDLEATAFFVNLTHEARIRGANYLIGPMNGSTYENYRLANEHNAPPFFLEFHYHDYYNCQFERASFASIARYYTNIDTDLIFDRAETLEKEREFARKGVTIRRIDLTRYAEELTRIRVFNDLAFKDNFLYAPISQEAFLAKYLPVRDLLHPEFTLIAEDAAGNLVGYYFCLDDLLNKTEKSLIVKTLARHPDPEWKGLGHVMGNIVYRGAIPQGYRSILHALIYEEGTANALTQNFSGHNYRNYLLYGKKIN